jgi:glycosyltransferase involved in cell wall biosynthesis
VTPTYNAASFIPETLASVYEHTVAPGEVIVVNDGSPDETESVLRRLGSSLPPSFTWISIPNSGGWSTPRNLGIERTNGEYVAFVDQDDMLVADNSNRGGVARWLIVERYELVTECEPSAVDPVLALERIRHSLRCSDVLIMRPRI